jgi:hypothetical protein
MDESDDRTEACGRCAMSSVSAVIEDDHDPFDEDRIEVEEADLRKVSPGVLAGRARRWLDGIARRLTYGR